jgi:hypothetical protein
MIKSKAGAEAKAEAALRKAALSEQLDREAQIASERVRRGFDAERQKLARRYGVATLVSSESIKN